MTSKIGGSVGGGNWKYAHGTAHYGRNFCVKWLKVHAHALFCWVLLSTSETFNLQMSNLHIAVNFM